MSVEDLIGSEFGPFHFRTCAEKVAEFVSATGDDADRWSDVPPPGYASLGLFAAATPFLSHPAVTKEVKTMLHGEQSFRWLRPFALEADYEARATLTRVRWRGSVAFVRLEISLAGSDGTQVVDAGSTFVLSDDRPPAGASVEEQEPDPYESAASAQPERIALPGPGEELPSLPKSASRADLVRYAAATRDWNPIHWDHAAAVRAGLPGVVCHGLLMAGWIIQAAARTVDGSHPLDEVRLRFRNPLRPAIAAQVTGHVATVEQALARLDMAVSSAASEHVRATVTVRTG